MTDRCVTTTYPNGSYCVNCEEQTEVIGQEAHLEPIIDRGWNAGANTIEFVDGPCYFSFVVPVDVGGHFGGVFNGVVSRDRRDPSSLALAIYLFAIGGIKWAQAYSYGIPIDDAQPVVTNDVLKIEWPSDQVLFKFNDTVFARTLMPQQFHRGGGTLFQSGDRIMSPEFDTLSGAAVEAFGRASVFIRAHGASADYSYGSASITLRARGESGSYGRARVLIAARGSSFNSYGGARVLIQARGYGIPAPVINYGNARVFIRGSGTLHYPQSQINGKARVFIKAVGNTFPDYGRATVTISARGFSNSDFQNYIFGFQSPGISQLVFGFERYTLSDEIDFGDVLANRLRILLLEAIYMSESLGTQGALRLFLHDMLGFDDRFIFRFIAHLADTIDFTDPVRIHQALRLLDTLVLSGVIAGDLDAKCILATTLTFADVLRKTFPVNIEDSIALDGQLRTIWNTHFDLIDSIEFSDELTGSAHLLAMLPDSIALSDDAGTALSAVVRMLDEIDFSIRVHTNNGVFIAYAMNTESKGASKYLNFPHNSYAKVGSRLFGGSSRGLVALEGADDDGSDINARIRTGLDSLGSTMLKRMVKAYLGYRADGDLLLRIDYTSPGGEKTTQVFRAKRLLADDFRETNVDIAKGMKSVYWSFELTNEDGADFALDCIAVIPLNCGSRANG